MNNIANLYQTFMQNPMALLQKRFNIPAGLNVQNPNDIIQYLLNSGQISQQQVNQAMQLQKNPAILNLFK